MQRTCIALIPALLLLMSIPLSAQTPDSPSSTPKYRVSVDLVEVDAVVTDKKGNHVAGLTADDFQVFEDGKQQKITHFSWVDDKPTAPQDEISPEAVNAPKRTLR